MSIFTIEQNEVDRNGFDHTDIGKLAYVLNGCIQMTATRCTNCGTESETQPQGDGCHVCGRGYMDWRGY